MQLENLVPYRYEEVERFVNLSSNNYEKTNGAGNSSGTIEEKIFKKNL